MSQTSDYYDARADEAEAAAGHAQLDNVRDRELRSAAVFRKLADQARKIVTDRAKADAIRLERRAAEAEQAARVRAENWTPRSR
jgi:hypothetical protein